MKNLLLLSLFLISFNTISQNMIGKSFHWHINNIILYKHNDNIKISMNEITICDSLYKYDTIIKTNIDVYYLHIEDSVGVLIFKNKEDDLIIYSNIVDYNDYFLMLDDTIYTKSRYCMMFKNKKLKKNQFFKLTEYNTKFNYFDICVYYNINKFNKLSNKRYKKLLNKVYLI